jgi:hypothetical protein
MQQSDTVGMEDITFEIWRDADGYFCNDRHESSRSWDSDDMDTSVDLVTRHIIKPAVGDVESPLCSKTGFEGCPVDASEPERAEVKSESDMNKFGGMALASQRIATRRLNNCIKSHQASKLCDRRLMCTARDVNDIRWCCNLNHTSHLSTLTHGCQENSGECCTSCPSVGMDCRSDSFGRQRPRALPILTWSFPAVRTNLIHLP